MVSTRTPRGLPDLISENFKSKLSFKTQTTIILKQKLLMLKILAKKIQLLSEEKTTINFDRNFYNILSIGRLEHEKDYKSALLSVSKLKDKIKNQTEIKKTNIEIEKIKKKTNKKIFNTSIKESNGIVLLKKFLFNSQNIHD